MDRRGVGADRRLRGGTGRVPDDADDRRAAGAEDAAEPPELPGDRRAAPRLREHRQDAGARRLPEARRPVALGGRLARDRDRPPRRLRSPERDDDAGPPAGEAEAMSNLIAIAYPEESTAHEVAGTLRELQTEQTLQ